MPEPPPTDPILAEIRRVRDRMAEEHHYDVASLFRTLRAEQAASGHRVVNYPPRLVEHEESSSEDAA
jgi:hypothetical protein